MSHFVSYENAQAILIGQNNYNARKYVLKDENKDLSTNDFTNAFKQKLTDIEEGAQVNDIEVIKVDGVQLDITGKAVNIDLASTYAKKSDITSLYKYKGSVATYAELPTENVAVGDVYNVEADDAENSIVAGDNVAWTGSAWDKLAGTVDMSEYVKAEEGKGLSSNDFTDALKQKLENSGNGDYVLPTASSDTLGGVKVGDNLEIDTNGVLKVKESALGTNVTVETTGEGNVVTSVSTPDANGKITVNKGATAITEHQDISGKQDKITAVTHEQATAVGSATKGVYINANGSTAEMTYSLEADVPAGAKFTDTDTHYVSKNVVASSNDATENTSAPITNGYVFLQSVENGIVTSSHKITGSGAVTVTSDASGNIIVSSAVEECTDAEILALFAETSVSQQE